MLETTTNYFRQHLKSEVDRCIDNHEVLKVKRRNGESFIVIGESDWKAIEETTFLNQVPGLVQSIEEATQEPLEEGTPLEELEW
ncbi:MAG: type II toxin-antitoxin system Phd/YefM family antitoxin [SAR324 cluster bacterium]|nr:type II toxin-antitoxin system Phd/YefM family antitoxin [SAR324 cluster bacterium]